MKYIIILSALFTLLFASCNKDFLDVKSPNLTDDAIFSDPVLFETYVINQYTSVSLNDKEAGAWGETSMGLARGHFWCMWACLTDEAVYSNDDQSYLVQRGQLSPSNYGWTSTEWGRSFRAIREVNLCLSKLPGIPMNEDKKNLLNAELRFLRAFRYFNLLKGSGLSSSASFEVLIGAIISHLFNGGRLDPVQNALIGQYAENYYFGKPCGLMDQTTCAVGGLVTIDFEDPSRPVVKKIDFDFLSTGFALVITDTGGNHADLNDEYASLPFEMKSVAAGLGAKVLRQLKLEQIVEAIPTLRGITGDRALLRAYHFQGDNQRVVKQAEALEQNDFRSFLSLVIESGYSSFMYNQNIFPVSNVKEQGVSLALALSEMVLKGQGAWRVHGGGFAGTVQAFVPKDLLNKYVSTLEHVFGKNSCHTLFIREKGVVKVDL